MKTWSVDVSTSDKIYWLSLMDSTITEEWLWTANPQNCFTSQSVNLHGASLLRINFRWSKIQKIVNLSKQSASSETVLLSAKIPESITGSSLTTGGIDLSSFLFSYSCISSKNYVPKRNYDSCFFFSKVISEEIMKKISINLNDCIRL